MSDEQKQKLVRKFDNYIVSYVDKKNLAITDPSKYENKIDSLKSKNAQMQSMINDYERLNGKYQKKYASCKSKLHEAKSSIRNKSQKVKSLKSSLADIENKLKNVKKKLSKVKAKKGYLEKNVKDLDSKLTEYKGKNQWLRKLEAKHREKKKEIKKKLTKLKKNNDILTQKLAQNGPKKNSFKYAENSFQSSNSEPASSDIFNEWEFLGMVDNSLVLGKLPSLNKTKIVRPGDNFMGVKIINVNLKDKYVLTEQGKWFWNT